MIPKAAQAHRRVVEELQAKAVRLGSARLRRIDPRNPVGSWSEQAPLLTAAMVGIQFDAALDGSTYSAMVLADQGDYVQPESFTNPDSFTGYASDGRGLESLLALPAARIDSLVDEGLPADRAMRSGVALMGQIMLTQIADIARQAAGADIASRPGVGYVRMVRPGGCSRCSILAGKFYRWNDGFLRHPRCNCKHVAANVASQAEAYANGLIDDPNESFKSLSESEQDRIYGKDGARAIREGADISQVVNARRGMTANGNFTIEGTTRRGNAAGNLKRGQRRMTPESIYKQAKTPEDARALLEYHGYTLPGGTIPGGSLRGQREGFGQLGGGGRRKGAVADIEAARRTGVRDPRNRNTMTAAERRLYDSEQRYRTALSGRSPYTSPGFSNKPDPYGLKPNATFRPVTPTELATAERDYRRWLATGGQKFSQ